MLHLDGQEELLYLTEAGRKDQTNMPMTVRVECQPGHRGEAVPRAFVVGDRRIEVVEVRDGWPGRDHRYFKVLGSDGGLYILRQDTPSGAWEITLFEQR